MHKGLLTEHPDWTGLNRNATGLVMSPSNWQERYLDNYKFMCNQIGVAHVDCYDPLTTCID